MIISAEWSDGPDQVIVIHYPPIWAWEEWDAQNARVERMMEGIEGPVGMLLDTRETIIPKDFLSHFPDIVRTAPGTTNAQFCRIVVVGNASVLQSMMAIVKRVYPVALRTLTRVDTMEEAFALFAEDFGG